jgi:hypothetical protein
MKRQQRPERSGQWQDNGHKPDVFAQVFCSGCLDYQHDLGASVVMETGYTLR